MSLVAELRRAGIPAEMSYGGRSGKAQMKQANASGAAYALLYAMALTSTDAAKRAMGRWWKVLHKAGIHWLWFVFASSYAGRLSDPDRWMIGAVFAPIAFAAAAIRFAAWIKVRRMHAARAVPA